MASFARRVTPLSDLPSVAVIGSITNDLVFSIESMPGPGQTVVSTDHSATPGGKGANIATAAYRASRENPAVCDSTGSVRVFMNGAVGDDEIGQSLKLGLERHGLDVSGIQTLQGHRTGQVVIMIEEDGRQSRSIGFKGANLEFMPPREDVECLAGDVGVKPDLLIANCTLRLETMERILATACAQGVETILNASPPVGLKSTTYEHVTHLVINEHEASRMSARSAEDLRDIEVAKLIAASFVDRGTKYVVITLGDKGAVYATFEGLKGHVSAVRNVAVIDTTGAGDSFLGAYAMDYLKQRRRGTWVIEQAIAFATKAASRTISAVGAQTSLPWLNEIEQI